jgi:2-methylaconitate isomerase
MQQRRIPAVFMRGGTANAVVFHQKDLPADRRLWDAIFLQIPGVAGKGAPVRLDFVSPGGAATGKLLPTGNVLDMLDVPGVGKIEVSMVDAANPCVFVRARDVGLSGTEQPPEVEANAEVMRKFAAIRCAASVAMGITRDIAQAATRLTNPAIGYVAPPQDWTLI